MQNFTKPLDLLSYLTDTSALLIPIPGVTASGGPGSDTFIGLSGNDRYFGAGARISFSAAAGRTGCLAGRAMI